MKRLGFAGVFFVLVVAWLLAMSPASQAQCLERVVHGGTLSNATDVVILWPAALGDYSVESVNVYIGSVSGTRTFDFGVISDTTATLGDLDVFWRVYGSKTGGDATHWSGQSWEKVFEIGRQPTVAFRTEFDGDRTFLWKNYSSLSYADRPWLKNTMNRVCVPTDSSTTKVKQGDLVLYVVQTAPADAVNYVVEVNVRATCGS